MKPPPFSVIDNGRRIVWTMTNASDGYLFAADEVVSIDGERGLYLVERADYSVGTVHLRRLAWWERLRWRLRRLWHRRPRRRA